MSKWISSLHRFLQVLCQPLIRLLRKLPFLVNPYKQLAKTCKTLQEQLETSPATDKAWPTYIKILSLARKCDRHELTQVIIKFDPLLREQNFSADLAVKKAISYLLEANPQNYQNLDAAWRLSQRLNDFPTRQEIQQQICLQVAQIGDSDKLIARLLTRRNEGSLTPPELSQILNIFCKNYVFQRSNSWRTFFEQFNPDELPKIHQVSAIFERYLEASELAEKARDYHSAINYLMYVSGTPAALRAAKLSYRLEDQEMIAQTHQRVAEIFVQESDYVNATKYFLKALKHFQLAGNRESTYYCYQRLEQINDPTPHSPSFSPLSPAPNIQGYNLSHSGELETIKKQLMRLLQGDKDACKRLIEFERKQNPHQSEIELYQAAIDRLKKDRRW